MAVIHAVPTEQDYTIVVSYDGLVDSAFQVATQLEALRVLVQELTETKALPAVVLQLAVKHEDPCSFSIKSRALDSNAASEVVCVAGSIEDAEMEFRDKFATSSTITFTTDDDRPGLLAEVTDLLKLHGANILRAKVTSEGASRSAKHVYEVQDATKNRRLSKAVLVRLEEDFRALRDAGSTVRRVVQKLAGGAVEKAERAGAEMPTEVGGGSDFMVRLCCPRGVAGADPWRMVAELHGLRTEMQELFAASAPPSVEMCFVDRENAQIEIWGSEVGAGGVCKVLVSGDSADDVRAKFGEKFGRSSTVTFSTGSDRPGLLAEVTELIRQHGANILHAEVGVDRSTNRALHTYRVEDAATRGRLSSTVLARLQEDFRLLRDAAPNVRQLLARGGM